MEETKENDHDFWERVVSLLLSLVCTIEKDKLHRKPTTSELREAGKAKLAQDRG